MAGPFSFGGKLITRFRRGQAVFVCAGMKMGTGAEYLAVPEAATLALVPGRLYPKARSAS